MFKKILFLLSFLLIMNLLCAGYKNTYIIDYSTTTEKSTMGLDGEMFFVSNPFLEKPTTGYVQINKTQGQIDLSTLYFKVNLDTTTTPSSTGIIGLNSNFKMYVSTSTNAGGWELIGSQS